MADKPTLGLQLYRQELSETNIYRDLADVCWAGMSEEKRETYERRAQAVLDAAGVGGLVESQAKKWNND